jgi:hypothetical protein
MGRAKTGALFYSGDGIAVRVHVGSVYRSATILMVKC